MFDLVLFVGAVVVGVVAGYGIPRWFGGKAEKEVVDIPWRTGLPCRDGEYLVLISDPRTARKFRREVRSFVAGEWGIWGSGKVVCWKYVDMGWQEFV